jgi:hypothetical protein
VQAFDFLTLAFHFLQLRFKVCVMLTVEGGGEVLFKLTTKTSKMRSPQLLPYPLHV